MKPYSSIDTLFERGPDRIVTDVLRRPILDHIKIWLVTEKIDGTNIRIGWERLTGQEDLRWFVAGRTDNASIPPRLHNHCLNIALGMATTAREIMDERALDSLTLYGEGYGAGIHGGGNYRPDQGFILFDVNVGGNTFINDEAVSLTADAFDVPRVPIIGHMTLDGIVTLVKNGFESQCAETTRPAEGIVARTIEPFYDNRGKRLIIKLKTGDFRSK